MVSQKILIFNTALAKFAKSIKIIFIKIFFAEMLCADVKHTAHQDFKFFLPSSIFFANEGAFVGIRHCYFLDCCKYILWVFDFQTNIVRCICSF